MARLYEAEAAKIAATMTVDEIVVGLDSSDPNIVLVSQRALALHGPEATEALIRAFDVSFPPYRRDARRREKMREIAHVTASAAIALLADAIFSLSAPQFIALFFGINFVRITCFYRPPSLPRPGFHGILRGMVALDDMRLLGRLIDAFSVDELAHDDQMISALSCLLNHLTDDDAQLISKERLDVLAELMGREPNLKLRIGVLRAIELFGDGSYFERISSLLRAKVPRDPETAWSYENWIDAELVDAAGRCLSAEEARHATRNQAQMLLRPGEPAESDSLLRSAMRTDTTDPSLLPRPAEEPAEAANRAIH